MFLDKIALILAIIGGLNWGSIGIFRFDIVAALFGGHPGGPGRHLVYLPAVPGHQRQGINPRRGPRGGPRRVSKKSFRHAAELFETSKSFKKLFDPTRKGTLTVPFHTIPPSESFIGRVS